MEGHIDLRPGGSPGARLDHANLSQVRDEAAREGLVTVDEMDQVLSLLEDPGFVFLTHHVQAPGASDHKLPLERRTE